MSALFWWFVWLRPCRPAATANCVLCASIWFHSLPSSHRFPTHLLRARSRHQPLPRPRSRAKARQLRTLHRALPLPVLLRPPRDRRRSPGPGCAALRIYGKRLSLKNRQGQCRQADQDPTWMRGTLPAGSNAGYGTWPPAIGLRRQLRSAQSQPTNIWTLSALSCGVDGSSQARLNSAVLAR